MTDLSAIAALEARVCQLESQNHELTRENERLRELHADTIPAPALDVLPSPREALTTIEWDASVVENALPEVG